MFNCTLKVLQWKKLSSKKLAIISYYSALPRCSVLDWGGEIWDSACTLGDWTIFEIHPLANGFVK